MASDRLTEQRAGASLERGPTQNSAYAIAGFFVLLCFGGFVYRAVKGLPIDAAFFRGMGEILAIVAAFTALTTPYLKSWRLKYDPTEIVESYSLFGLRRFTSYPLSAFRSITSYHADPTMLGIPFDTLIFDFGANKLALRMSDWTRESLKQFIRDLISYRSDVPVDQPVLNFVAGEYDGIFYDASDGGRSPGYADRAGF